MTLSSYFLFSLLLLVSVNIYGLRYYPKHLISKDEYLDKTVYNFPYCQSIDPKDIDPEYKDIDPEYKDIEVIDIDFDEEIIEKDDDAVSGYYNFQNQWIDY